MHTSTEASVVLYRTAMAVRRVPREEEGQKTVECSCSPVSEETSKSLSFVILQFGVAQLLFRALEHSHCLYPLLSPCISRIVPTAMDNIASHHHFHHAFQPQSRFQDIFMFTIHLSYDHFRRNPWLTHSPPFPHHSPFPPPFTSVIRIAPAFLPLPVFNSLSTLHPRYIYSLVYSAPPPLFAFLLLHTLDQTGYRTYPQ